MSSVAAAASKAELHRQAQRERILQAALSCFVKSGFHNASVATIAETASMSTGLIYRYFENKNAIILAIIEAQLNVARRRIREMRNTDDLTEAIIEYFYSRNTDTMESMSAALFLEMSAEATRDPEIAAAVCRLDTTIRQEIIDWLTRDAAAGGQGLPRDGADARALAWVLLIEGLKARKAREPDLDRQTLREAIERTFGALLERQGES